MSQPLQQVINLPIKSQKVSKEIEEIKPKKKNIFIIMTNKVSSKISSVFHKVETKFQTKATELQIVPTINFLEKVSILKQVGTITENQD